MPASVDDKRMSLVDHLDELRKRVILCLIAAAIGIIVAYCFYNPWILNCLRGPLDTLNGQMENPFVIKTPLVRLLNAAADRTGDIHLKLHFIGPTEAFAVKLKASFFAGLIFSLPFILFQIWKFVTCALKEREKTSVRLFFPLSVLLFMFGLLIAYFVMLPMALYFLVIVVGSGLEPTLILSKYVSLVVVCCLAFGIVFEMPLIIVFLTRLGIVSPSFLIRNRKYAILIMFISAAILTPPDAVTQLLLGLPMVALYEGSIWFSKIAWARREQNS